MQKSNQITIDILLATYNGEKYIREQIDSILSQSYSNFRLIIADDCSTDNTQKILRDYAQLDHRITLMINEVNLGVVKNFERLISISTSKYFMLSDQDDVWHHDKIAKSLKAITETNSLLVYSDLRVVDQSLNQISLSFWRYQKLRPLAGKPWRQLLVQNVVTGCTVIARKELRKYALPFPDYVPMHDWWLGLAASIYGEIAYINEVLIDYRQHENNEVGASGLLGNIKNKTRGIKSYKDFLTVRNENLFSRLNMYKDIKVFVNNISPRNKENNFDVMYALDYLILTTRKSITSRWMNIMLTGCRQKTIYPSQGLLRNVWWGLLMDFPILSYALILFGGINNK